MSVVTATFPDALPLSQARDKFLRANRFRVEDYAARTYTIRVGGLSVKFPNTKAHQWATPLHDLHHILTQAGAYVKDVEGITPRSARAWARRPTALL